MKSYLFFAGGIAVTLLVVVGMKAFHGPSFPSVNTAKAPVSSIHAPSVKKDLSFAAQEKRPVPASASSSSYSAPLSPGETPTTAQDAPASQPAPQSSYASSASSVASAPSSALPNEASASSVVPTSDGGMEIVVSGSASIPAVLAAGAQEVVLPNQTQKSPAAAKVDQIAKDFVDNVSPDSDGNPATPEQWEDAAYLADEQYRALKGSEAYMARSLEAAKEALKNSNP